MPAAGSERTAIVHRNLVITDVTCPDKGCAALCVWRPTSRLLPELVFTEQTAGERTYAFKFKWMTQNPRKRKQTNSTDAYVCVWCYSLWKSSTWVTSNDAFKFKWMTQNPRKRKQTNSTDAYVCVWCYSLWKSSTWLTSNRTFFFRGVAWLWWVAAAAFRAIPQLLWGRGKLV